MDSNISSSDLSRDNSVCTIDFMPFNTSSNGSIVLLLTSCSSTTDEEVFSILSLLEIIIVSKCDLVVDLTVSILMLYSFLSFNENLDIISPYLDLNYSSLPLLS